MTLTYFAICKGANNDNPRKLWNTGYSELKLRDLLRLMIGRLSCRSRFPEVIAYRELHHFDSALEIVFLHDVVLMRFHGPDAYVEPVGNFKVRQALRVEP